MRAGWTPWPASAQTEPMSQAGLDLPLEVRRRAMATGGAAQAWLADLPALAADIARDWGLTLGATLHGGSAAYVAQARTATGGAAVLKVQMPVEPAFENELEPLLLAHGRGYVRVLRHDRARRAMLQEPLGRRLSDLGLSIDAQMQAICATLRQAWVPATPQPWLNTGAEKAAWLTKFIGELWEELGRPCSQRVIDQAAAFAQARAAAYDPERSVLVHGDAHASNTLEALDWAGGFKLVDPDALFGEPAYDLAIPMRDWSAELLAGDPLALGRARCTRLAALSGLDPEPIWQWGVIERVSTGLFLMKLNAEAEGREMLRVSEAWAQT
jgi:streptomycin 6-kinase